MSVGTPTFAAVEREAMSSPAMRTLIQELRNWNSCPRLLGKGGTSTSLGRAESQAIREHTHRLASLSDSDLTGIVKHIDDTLFPPGKIHVDLVLTRNPEALSTLALADLRFVLRDAFYEITDALASLDDSPILARFPELSRHLDDDGLLILDGLVRPERCVLTYNEYALYYSQFLRRSFSANTNDNFTSALCGHYEHTNNKVAVAIDHLRLIEREHASEWFEFDRWWGPSFDARRLDEPRAPELTLHEDPEGLPALLSDYRKTEFYWTSDDQGLRTMQAEELVPLDRAKALSGYVLCRYVHTIRDTSAKKFVHLDGAVRLYRAEDYAGRYEAKLPIAQKAARYIKLFRVDGDIADSDWGELLTSFFRGNHHILDYLNPELEQTDPDYGEYRQTLRSIAGAQS